MLETNSRTAERGELPVHQRLLAFIPGIAIPYGTASGILAVRSRRQPLAPRNTIAHDHAGISNLAVGDQALVHRERVTVSAGVGDGDGSWRLELDTDLDIEARAYAYTPEDVGRIDQTVAEIGGTAMRYDVPFFNPASNVAKRSTLRLVNLGNTVAEVEIRALDDNGDAAPEGVVQLTVPSGEARELSARALESGNDDFGGRLGDGVGKWRLSIRGRANTRVTNRQIRRVP